MPQFAKLKVGDALPERRRTADTVTLFMFNAAIWNPHRIHYDHPYTTEVEHHPALLIDGPLIGDWLSQTVLEWLGEDGELTFFRYSNRKAAYVNDEVVTGGNVAAIDADKREVTLSLFVRDKDGDNITPGGARVRLRA
ncbi:MAG: hypothetical protein HY342_00555 [Candidatus Lambdaproteobacteria bacterium]|nr:hypothetical protein [Candidatus Lambdaproteobacteria bacterium]